MTVPDDLHSLRTLAEHACVSAADQADPLPPDSADRAEIRRYARSLLATEPDPPLLGDDTARALARARIALAQAIVAAGPEDDGGAGAEPVRVWHEVGADALRVLRILPGRVRSELRAVLFTPPYRLLLRVPATIAVAVTLLWLHRWLGWHRYDTDALVLYVFGAVIGSGASVNALCADPVRVRAQLRAREPLWRILVVKNLTLALVVALAAVPVIVLLTVGTDDLQPLVLIDQLVAMLFIWLGVANMLSVVLPLRQEPLWARRTDGTLRRYLASFAVSYGIGLAVNVMIYWRLWARQAAAEEITGGAWTAMALVFVSSALSWLLLTVTATAVAHHPALRRNLGRELHPRP